MKHASAAAGRSPSRRRGSRLEDALLDAAWAELTEYGWSDFSMSRTAERAGASKKSLYARWPGKAAIVVAASRRTAVTRLPSFALEDDLERNLKRALADAAALLGGVFGDVVRGLYAELPSLPAEFREIQGDVHTIQTAGAIIDHARESGELGAGSVPARVVNLGFHLVTLHYLTHNAAPADEVISEIVTAVWVPCLRAAAAG